MKKSRIGNILIALGGTGVALLLLAMISVAGWLAFFHYAFPDGVGR